MSGSRKYYYAILLIVGLLTLRQSAMAAGGDLDPTFVNPNIVSTFSSASVTASVLQPDGKIVIGGSFTAVGGSAQISLSRLNADGTRDSTFNSPFVQGSTQSQVNALLLMPDGKIVVGGILVTAGNVNSNLLRVNQDGTVDPAFVVNPQDVFGIVGKLVFQNNIIYVAGAFSGVTLLNPNGSLIHRLVTGYSTPKFAVQPDGRVIFAVPQPTGGFVTRILDIQPDPVGFPALWGKNDPSFAPVQFDSGFNDVNIQADGRAIITGNFLNVNSSPKKKIVRLNTDGSVDTSFNVSLQTPGSLLRVAFQTDGKLIAVGSIGLIGDSTRRGFVRLNADGSLDNTFNSSFPAGNTDYAVRSALIDPAGNVIVTGDFPSIGSTPMTLVARLLGVGSPPAPTKLKIAGGNLLVGSPGQGIILKSPNGATCKLLSIDNAGAMALAAITCP